MNSEKDIPSAIGSPPRVFDIVLAIVKQAGAKKILDCPAGEGPFSQYLINAGLDVTACDIYPDQFAVPEIECVLGDMNGDLPFDDGAFDAVVCLNGLQRVWARGQALKEIARVLKPEGLAIISYPNQGDLRRRIMYVVTGNATWNVVGPPHTCDPAADPPASNFRYAMTTANVLSGMKSVGLRVELLKASHYTLSSALLSPMAIIPKLASWLAPKSKREYYFLRESTSLDALLGAFLIAVGRKDKNFTIKTRDMSLTNR